MTHKKRIKKEPFSVDQADSAIGTTRSLFTPEANPKISQSYGRKIMKSLAYLESMLTLHLDLDFQY